jgi:hypothetical protein
LELLKLIDGVVSLGAFCCQTGQAGIAERPMTAMSS